MLLMKQPECEEDDGVQERSPDGRFVRYDEVLGTGAFKVVYKGFDQENKVHVAWYQISIDDKVLDSPELKESLLSGAALLKSVNHENIIKYHYSWVDYGNKNINIITEFFSSKSLRHYRKNHKYVDIRALKRWGRQILEGLQYLHCQDPPLAHGDLRCDNIFVNGIGNHVEVKIGHLGLAAIINQATSKSVLGSPEFMAPELYDEEYNELVDLYSFGMCMLELITCEYPYSECKNQAHIVKEVTAGVKPLALEKVKVPEVKELIKKCLGPASQRLSAAELLKDPFFSAEKPEEIKYEPMELPFLVLPKSAGVSNPDYHVCTGFEPSNHKLSDRTSAGSIKNTSPASTLQSSHSTDEINIRLKGKRIDAKSIAFDLHIACLRSLVANKFEFAFDIEADDALQVAVELVRGKNLSFRHLPLVVEQMDNMLLELAPGWDPCYGWYKATNREF